MTAPRPTWTRPPPPSPGRRRPDRGRTRSTPPKERKPLAQFKAQLQGLEGGTVPVSYVLEMLETAEHEIEARKYAVTIPEAILKSGRSRSYFERRLKAWVEEDRAQKRGRQWFLDAEVVPQRKRRGSQDEGFDPDADPAEAARLLLDS